MMRNAVIFGGLAVALLGPTALIIQKEALLASGKTVLLELAPRDPRSLIQGDYMALDYAMSRQLADSVARWPRTGRLVVRRDFADVARFVRRHDDGAPLAAGEQLLVYRTRDSQLRVGSDAFHFQEGDAPRYAGARYGELRVAADGESVLVGLRDSAGRVLGER